MQRYYSPFWSQTEPFYLPEDESRHCISVMRNQIEDKIHVLDGKGNMIEAKIAHANPKKVELEFCKLIKSSESPHPLHIAISPTKSNDRIEWFIEKACEIGVGQITPLICQRTERTKINLDRWNKIVISSCKQSGLLHFPVISEIITLSKLVQNCHKEFTYVTSIGVEKNINEVEFQNSPTTILIGPEGDFSEEEFTLIRKLGIKEVSISDNILRVETAGLVAVTVFNGFTSRKS